MTEPYIEVIGKAYRETGTRRTADGKVVGYKLYRPPEVRTRLLQHGLTVTVKTRHGRYDFMGPEYSTRCKDENGSENCEYSRRSQALLRRYDSTGRMLWQRRIDPRYADRVVLVGDDADAYVTLFSSISTGATMTGFDARTGGSWSTWLEGMVDAHSAYANEVRVALDKDRVVACGLESAGIYVTTLARRTGHTVCDYRVYW